MTSGVRPIDGRNDRTTGSGRIVPGRSPSMAGVSATTRAAGITAGARPARFASPRGGADERGPRSVVGAGPARRGSPSRSAAAAPAVAAPAEVAPAVAAPAAAADAANAPAAAAAPAADRPLSGAVSGRSLPDAGPFAFGVATVSLTRVPSASSSPPTGAAASGPASPVATPEAAAAAKAPASASVPERSSSNEDSYSPTVAKIGRPADAASARVAPSPATIESRLPLVSASRARRRKLMREVATREPYGSTTATRLPSADRMRAAAEVISSSMSR